MDGWSWSVKCSMSIRLKDSGFIYYMIGKKQQKKKGNLERNTKKSKVIS